jgi:hypothetical protein
MMRLLELFSGTHSVGKVAKSEGYEVVSLDLILPADIKADIMTWNYKVYPPGYFNLITASPVCLWWSKLRNSWVGRKMHGKICTKESLKNDIDKFGKPMVDKVFEIIDYFKPKYWWVENPQSGKMKDYINKPYYDVDYCMYSEWGYKKRTRFWTNIKGFTPKTCDKKCKNIVGGRHKKVLGNGYVLVNGKSILANTKELRKKYKGAKCSSSTNKLDRYRIPPQLIKELLLYSPSLS